jgi:hypothetical protein
VSEGDRNTPWTWALTLLVLAVGVWQLVPRDADGPTAAPAAEATPDPWTVEFALELTRLDAFTIADVVEVGPAGERTPFSGKLWVHVDDEVRLAFPAIDGKAEVELPPPLLKRLAASRTLGLEFKGHARKDVELPWLKELGKPSILASSPADEQTELTVRNNAIRPLTVRVRAGWRQGARWMDDGERGEAHAARQDVRLAPGEVRAITLTYAKAPAGELSPPQARLLLD